jgi:hypothetical protein
MGCRVRVRGLILVVAEGAVRALSSACSLQSQRPAADGCSGVQVFRCSGVQVFRGLGGERILCGWVPCPRPVQPLLILSMVGTDASPDRRAGSNHVFPRACFIDASSTLTGERGGGCCQRPSVLHYGRRGGSLEGALEEGCRTAARWGAGRPAWPVQVDPPSTLKTLGYSCQADTGLKRGTTTVDALGLGTQPYQYRADTKGLSAEVSNCFDQTLRSGEPAGPAAGERAAAGVRLPLGRGRPPADRE